MLIEDKKKNRGRRSGENDSDFSVIATYIYFRSNLLDMDAFTN